MPTRSSSRLRRAWSMDLWRHAVRRRKSGYMPTARLRCSRSSFLLTRRCFPVKLYNFAIRARSLGADFPLARRIARATSCDENSIVLPSDEASNGSSLQIGQLGDPVLNHRTAHSAWNLCPQLSRTAPMSNCERHIVQSSTIWVSLYPAPGRAGDRRSAAARSPRASLEPQHLCSCASEVHSLKPSHCDALHGQGIV